MDGAGAVTLKVTEVVAVPKVLPVAVTVTVLLDAALGVPEMMPVAGSMLSPAGRVPDVTAYDMVPKKPV